MNFSEFNQLLLKRQHAIAEKSFTENENGEEDPKIFKYEEFLLTNGGQIVKTLCGFSIKHFDKLASLCQQSLSHSGKGRRGIVFQEKMLIFLCWATSGMTYVRIAFHLRIKTTMVAENIPNVIKNIRQVLQSKFLPTVSTEIDNIKCFRSFTNYPNTFWAVDSTIFIISRPLIAELRKKYYSGKHKEFCIKIQCLVNPDGVCIHYHGIFPGTKHDLKIFENSNLHTFLRKRERLRNGSYHYTHPQILADSGYQGAQHIYPEIIIPFKKPKNGELIEAEKEINQKISVDRIIVENFFGRMKTIFGCCHETIRVNRNLMDDLICINVCLTNYHIKKNPLRIENHLNESAFNYSSNSYDFNLVNEISKTNPILDFLESSSMEESLRNRAE